MLIVLIKIVTCFCLGALTAFVHFFYVRRVADVSTWMREANINPRPFQVVVMLNIACFAALFGVCVVAFMTGRTLPWWTWGAPLAGMITFMAIATRYVLVGQRALIARRVHKRVIEVGDTAPQDVPG